MIVTPLAAIEACSELTSQARRRWREGREKRGGAEQEMGCSRTVHCGPKCTRAYSDVLDYNPPAPSAIIEVLVSLPFAEVPFPFLAVLSRLY